MNVRLPLYKVTPLYRGDHERRWMATPHGYINGEAWLACLKVLVNLMKPHRGEEEVIIYVDNASAHKNLKTIQYLLEHKVYLVYIPAGTTDMIQPLDDKILASWRNCLGRHTHRHFRLSAHPPGPLTEAILALSPKAEAEALVPGLIRAAWKDTGLYPWNPDQVARRILMGRRLPVPELYPPDKEIIEQHMTVFRDLLEDANKPDIEMAKLSVPMHKPYTGEEVVEANDRKLAAARRREEKRERKKLEKEELALERKRVQAQNRREAAARRKQKAKHKIEAAKSADKRKIETSCRLCGASSRSASMWLGCDKCEWWVCPICRKQSNGDDVVAAHELIHDRKSRKKRRRRDSPGPDGL
jgi:hypothetical protein